MQSYLKSDKIMPKVAMKIFMYRGRMSPVKGNFKTKYENDF